MIFIPEGPFLESSLVACIALCNPVVVGSIPVPINVKINRLRVLVLARLERPQTNPAKTSDQETAGSIPAEISANGARVVVWSTTPQKSGSAYQTFAAESKNSNLNAKSRGFESRQSPV